MTDLRAGQTASTATSVGDIASRFGWAQSFDPSISYGTDTKVVSGASQEMQITKIGTGWLEVTDSNGQVHRLTEWNGKPITHTVIDSDGHATELPAPGVPIKNESFQDGNKGGMRQMLVMGSSPSTTTVVPHTVKASQLMGDIGAMASSSDPVERQKFVDIQNKLVKAGLLDPKNMIPGVDDDFTQKALQTALIYTDRTRGTDTSKPTQDLNTVLDSLATTNSATVRTHDFHVTGATDVAAATNKIAADVIGRAATPQELAALTSGYNAIETANQQAAFSASDANAGYGGAPGVTTAAPGVATSVSTTPPSLGDYIQQQLRSQNPVAAQGMEMGHYLSQFMSLLGGGGSPTPSTFNGG